MHNLMPEDNLIEKIGKSKHEIIGIQEFPRPSTGMKRARALDIYVKPILPKFDAIKDPEPAKLGFFQRLVKGKKIERERQATIENNDKIRTRIIQGYRDNDSTTKGAFSDMVIKELKEHGYPTKAPDKEIETKIGLHSYDKDGRPIYFIKIFTRDEHEKADNFIDNVIQRMDQHGIPRVNYKNHFIDPSYDAINPFEYGSK